jgi:hypothetical protein
MNIGFWDNCLCERGTTVSLYDYAYYNEKLLGNKSYIFYDKNRIENNLNVIEKFKNKFIVHETDNFKEIDELLLKYNITHLYIIKAGGLDSRLSKVAKNCIHCVFTCNQPHGDIYSTISPYVGNNKYPVVPHMINLPQHNKNMREKLNIPLNAVVFGGYGGKYSFSIDYVKNTVYNIANNNSNIYFLFANFNKFCPNLPNIIHLSTIVDLNEKVEFINTCDAMLWAKAGGETFGLSIGEFSLKNKPIICTKSGDLGHVQKLGDNAIWYNNQQELSNILLSFNPEIESKKDWNANAYKENTPENVMNIFKDIYLKN